MPRKRCSRRDWRFGLFDLALGPYDALFDRLTRGEQAHMLRALRAYWFAHAEDVMASWVVDHPGTRPWAWWEFTQREPWPTGPEELARLLELGVIGEDERLRTLALEPVG